MSISTERNKGGAGDNDTASAHTSFVFFLRACVSIYTEINKGGAGDNDTGTLLFVFDFIYVRQSIFTSLYLPDYFFLPMRMFIYTEIKGGAGDNGG